MIVLTRWTWISLLNCVSSTTHARSGWTKVLSFAFNHSEISKIPGIFFQDDYQRELGIDPRTQLISIYRNPYSYEIHSNVEAAVSRRHRISCMGGEWRVQSPSAAKHWRYSDRVHWLGRRHHKPDSHSQDSSLHQRECHSTQLSLLSRLLQHDHGQHSHLLWQVD